MLDRKAKEGMAVNLITSHYEISPIQWLTYHCKSATIQLESMHCYLEYIGERGEPTNPGLARRPSDFFSDPGNQGLIMLLWSGVIFDRSSARKSSAQRTLINDSQDGHAVQGNGGALSSLLYRFRYNIRTPSLLTHTIDNSV